MRWGFLERHYTDMAFTAALIVLVGAGLMAMHLTQPDPLKPDCPVISRGPSSIPLPEVAP
jgi:hypothetical protein